MVSILEMSTADTANGKLKSYHSFVTFYDSGKFRKTPADLKHVEKAGKLWRAWGDSNARPLVPEISSEISSDWFAWYLAAPEYTQLAGFRHLSFPNLSQVSAKQETAFGVCSSSCIQYRVEL
jgi:hypothetical protein